MINCYENGESTMKKIVLYLTLCLFSIFLVIGSVHASENFQGKKVTWILPFKVGGGTDVWSRLYSPFFTKHLPGNPIVAVKNMPGGGSITGGNFFHSRIKKSDGLTVFGSSGSTSFPYLLGNSKVKYDFSKYHIVFASPTGGVTYINPKLGVKSIKDLKGSAKEMNYASQGATSLDIVPLLAYDMLGLNVKAIFGYKGRGSGRVAFEQGEVDIDYQTSTGYLKNVIPLVKQGLAVPLMTWGILDDNGNIVRDPIAPELPCFPEAYELIYGKKPSGQAWNAWKAFFIAGFGVQKAMWLPEKTKPAIIKVYRDTAAKVIADQEFQKVVDKSLGGYHQLAGESAYKAFQQVLNVSAQDKAWVIQWIKDRYGVEVK